MSFLFGGEEPQPAAVPISPLASEEAQRQRQAAEEAALAESRSAGRRQTVVAGMKIAEDEQAGKGLLSAKKRAAARDLGG